MRADDGHRPAMPDTALAWALWRALERWARRELRSPVTLSVGRRVDADELKKVVLAIVRIRRAQLR